MIKLTFTGDIMCSKEYINYTKLRKHEISYDCALSEIKNYFSNSDYAIANLETPIAGKSFDYTSHKWSFNAPIDFAKSLKHAGIDMVTTANNHCLDRGVDGLLGTIKNLDKIGLEHTGTFYDTLSKGRYLLKDICGIKVAFMSYTYGTNASFNKCYLSKRQKTLINMFQSQERSASRWNLLFRYVNQKIYNSPKYRFNKSLDFIDSEVKRARLDGAEYIVLLMHAGGQYGQYPSADAVYLADKLSGLNIDAIIGNHEHVVHEMSVNSNRQIVAYSLGNFMSFPYTEGVPYDGYLNKTNYSSILNLYLEKDEDKVRLKRATFSLVKNAIDQGEYRVRVLDAKDKDEIDYLVSKVLNKQRGSNHHPNLAEYLIYEERQI